MERSVRILLFATAREAVGHARLSWPIPTEGVVASTLLSDLETAHPSLGAVLKVSRVVQNGKVLRSRATRILPGDELAIHPPYSGG